MDDGFIVGFFSGLTLTHLILTNTFFHMMTINQLDQLKNAYAEMIVEGMDMNTLITLAVESIEENIKDYDMEDLKEEIIDCYGEETWTDMNS